MANKMDIVDEPADEDTPAPLEFKIRLTIKMGDSDYFFGPGIAFLMYEIKKNGNISDACKQMGMAYSKAWKIIKRAEDALGFKLVEGQAGRGKGSVITEKGAEFLDNYDRFVNDVKKFTETSFKMHFNR